MLGVEAHRRALRGIRRAAYPPAFHPQHALLHEFTICAPMSRRPRKPRDGSAVCLLAGVCRHHDPPSTSLRPPFYVVRIVCEAEYASARCTEDVLAGYSGFQPRQQNEGYALVSPQCAHSACHAPRSKHNATTHIVPQATLSLAPALSDRYRQEAAAQLLHAGEDIGRARVQRAKYKTRRGTPASSRHRSRTANASLIRHALA